MTVRFVKRVAGQLLNRGESKVRVNPVAIEDVKKAITRDDVRKLIKDGAIYAVKEKKNTSARSKVLKIKRQEGRRRGIGKRKGTPKARKGMTWEKKARAQRFVIKELKAMKKLDTKNFNELYGLIKGNSFPDKASLIRHIKDTGIEVNETELKAIQDKSKALYK